jgi:hypothetical protein
MVQVSITRKSSISKVTSQRALYGTVQGTAFVSSELTLGSAIAEPHQVFGGSMAAEKPGSGASPALGTASFVNVLQHNPKEVSKLMKKAMFSLLAVFALAAMASAQLTGVSQDNSETTDILGAHLGYGRGCVMCHAPHSGAGGNNVKTADTTSGDYALWGQDLTPLYGQTLNFGDGGTFPVTLPAAGTITSAHDANTVVLFCLSCHDGNLAKVGMMKGKTVETLPIVGGNAPTLLGSDGTVAGNYENDHPVGATALVSCGPPYNWDCTGGGATKIVMSGPNSTQFGKNYDFGVIKNLATIGTNVNAVTCTTCHNQHSQNIYTSTAATPGYYKTMFFLRGYYNPSTGGNNAAQFCRQCHGGEANESNGQYGVLTN